MVRHGLVLAAGLGTRLRPLTLERAKPAMTVGGVPIIRRILSWLAAEGVTDLVVNLHHLPETITSLVGDGSDLGARVRYSWEQPVVLGSAGGPRHALPIIGAKTFFIVNGDTLTDLPLRGLAEAHASTKAMVTMALVPNREPEKYGGVRMGDDGSISGFVTRGAQAVGSYHFIGVQVAEAEAFASLPDNTPHESVGALYPSLMAARRGAVRAHVCAAEFMDIGTPADYLQTALLLRDREAGASARPFDIGAGSTIAESARIENSILWDDVEVGDGAMLRECVVTDGAQVPGDTSWIGVSIRRFEGDLAPHERRIGDLAVASL